MPGFYSRPEWTTLRRRALERDRWRCTLCNASLHGRGRSRVDHIRSRQAAPSLALVLANLRSLCPACDNARHAEKGGAPGRLLVGADASGWPTASDHPWNQPARPPLRAAAGEAQGGESSGKGLASQSWPRSAIYSGTK
jgi:5-methylcytosine-specific restriction endonuclease McrA